MQPYPPHFTHNVIGAHGEAGRTWLAELPRISAGCAARWGLALGEPYELSFHMVRRATLPDGRAAVLKLIPPFDPLHQREAATLGAWGGGGAVALLGYAPERGALLLERAVPGTTLAHHPDDDEATRITARLMRRLWVPPPAGYPGLTAAERYAALDEARGTVPADLLDAARRQRDDLLATAAPPVVLHGDLHHGNILRSGAGWQAIDPHGISGEPCCEVPPLLYNPPMPAARLATRFPRRTAILAAELGLPVGRIRRWAFVGAVLSAWWSYEDDNPADAQHTETFARLIRQPN
jgi:streptomycin 6-kinase